MTRQPIPRPVANTYWVEEPHFLAGEYPGALHAADIPARLTRFLDAGILTFFDLTTPADKMTPYAGHLSDLGRERGLDVRRVSVPIPDLGLPSSRTRMTLILEEIDVELSRGRGVYVHCWGGVGRTGTVVGCWLAERAGSGDQALLQLAELWHTVEKFPRKPRSPETAAQRAYVRAWV